VDLPPGGVSQPSYKRCIKLG